jgi:hypothetical protein
MPSVVVVFLCYAALQAARIMPWGLAILVLPGTFAHELAHFITGLLLGAKPSGISLRPRRSGKGWRLGATSFRRIGLLNGAFISLAPLSLLPLAWFCLMRLAVPSWAMQHWGSWLGAAYLAATLCHGSMPSVTDLKVGGRSLLMYSAGGMLLWLLLPLVRSRLF